jgi:hypothetical protein
MINQHLTAQPQDKHTVTICSWNRWWGEVQFIWGFTGNSPAGASNPDDTLSWRERIRDQWGMELITLVYRATSVWIGWPCLVFLKPNVWIGKNQITLQIFGSCHFKYSAFLLLKLVSKSLLFVWPSGWVKDLESLKGKKGMEARRPWKAWKDRKMGFRELSTEVTEEHTGCVGWKRMMRTQRWSTLHVRS